MARKTKKNSARCAYYVGARKDTYEVQRLCYKPTGNMRPIGWKFAWGPYRTKAEAEKTARRQAGEHTRVVVRDRRRSR